MLDQIIVFLCDLAVRVLSLLPVVDTSSLDGLVADSARLVSWISQLDEAFPVTEGFIMLGIVFAVWFALYGFMIVRRAFSLIWPGAGS